MVFKASSNWLVLIVLAGWSALFCAPVQADDVTIRISASDTPLLISPQHDGEVVRLTQSGDEFTAVTTCDDFYLVEDLQTGSFLFVPFYAAQVTGVPLPDNIHISGRMAMPDQMDLSYWQVAPGSGDTMDEMKLRGNGDTDMLVAHNGKKYPSQYEYNNDYNPVVDGRKMIRDARQYLGATYVLGGTTTKGIDCSGLTQVCLAEQGIDVVHRSSLQALHGRYISHDELKAGDVLFFRDDKDIRYLSHVGIYLGGSRFIHASGSRDSVAVTSLNDEYFKSHYAFARRF